MKVRSIAWVMVLVLLGCSGREADDASNTTAEVPDGGVQIAVPVGHPLLVQLQEDLSTEGNKAGDTFTGVLLEPVTIAHRGVVVPSGSPILGRIDVLDPPVDGRPAAISLSIIEIGGKPAHTNLLKLEGTESAEESMEEMDEGGMEDSMDPASIEEFTGNILGDDQGVAGGEGNVAGPKSVILVATQDTHIRLPDGQRMRFQFTEPYVISRGTA